MTLPAEKDKAKKLTEGSLSSSIKTKINQVTLSSTLQDDKKSLESSDNFGSYEKYSKQ